MGICDFVFGKRTAVFFALALLCLSPLVFAAADNAATGDKATLYLFWGDGCPHCEDEQGFLQNLQSQYPGLEVKKYEVWNNPDNAEVYSQMAEAYGTTARGVPGTFIDDKVWIGFSPYIEEQIEFKVKYCTTYGLCRDAMEVMQGSPSPAQAQTCVHVFMQSNCTQCASLLPYLNSIAGGNAEITVHDVSNSSEAALYNSFKQGYGIDYAGYPVAFIGDRYIIGEAAIRQNLGGEIVACAASGGCVCPVQKISGVTPVVPRPKDITPEETIIIDVPFMGKVEVSSMSIYGSTVIIGLLDGFNPCSLWLIAFLLAIVVHSGSRRKIAAVGLTFLITATAMYGLFLVGFLNVFVYVGHLFWVRFAVAAIAMVFAVVNIKDYFWYKKGVSFTISDKYKPGIFKRMRDVMHPDKSMLAIVAATAVMALGVTLVELPCTAGLPVVWANLVAQSHAGGPELSILTAIYLVMYILDELAVFLIVLFTMKAAKFEEKHGRMLKLVGGCIMFCLAISMVFFYKIMESITGSLMLFLFAIVVAFAVMFIHRRVLPKYGIKIGTEELGEETKEKVKNKEGVKNREKVKKDGNDS